MQNGEWVKPELYEMEAQLKDLWARYVAHLESQGANNKSTLALREEYFELYRLYRRQKKWMKTLNTNKGGTV